MEECLFCKIVSGAIPAEKVTEDGCHLAFLDIYPANKGHTLVIPKKHYAHFSQVHGAEIGDYIKFVQKIAFAVKKSLNADGVNVFLNEGKAAGQLIMHAHFHILPRFEGDGLEFKVNRLEYADEAEKRQFARRIAAAVV
ncbi:MAG TPA: HIT family protein [Candidatus Norongarragalinales archaeon]|nr:HIT family protein [Candidatus Norongarragalinales archaeon]